MELCEELSIPCIERNLDVYDVVNADEAFMSGTPFCLLPVTSLNGQQIGSGKMGDITKKILDMWGENVGVDIIGQIKTWNAKSTKKDSNLPSPYAFKKK